MVFPLFQPFFSPEKLGPSTPSTRCPDVRRSWLPRDNSGAWPWARSRARSSRAALRVASPNGRCPGMGQKNCPNVEKLWKNHGKTTKYI